MQQLFFLSLGRGKDTPKSSLVGRLFE